MGIVQGAAARSPSPHREAAIGSCASAARLLLLAACAAFPASLASARPPAFVPSDPGQVLERLPAGYSAVGKAVRAKPTQADVDRMLAIAGRSGDARMVSRAAAVLDDIAGKETAATLKARAYIAQYRHDFEAAAIHLDRAIALDRRDTGARVSRAQVDLVTGHLRKARDQCAALLVLDTGAASLCLAALALRRGELDTAIRLADGLRRGLSARGGQGAGADAPVAVRHVFLLRAEAASRAGAVDADTWFLRALAVDPEDVRTLAAYARHLRNAGRHARVLALLRDAPVSDTLLLERVLAADALGDASAAALAGQQARRHAAAQAAGIEPELREQALFELAVRGDPDRALQLALTNFRTQRDHEDVDILVRSAVAAGRRDALRPLRDWAAAEQVALAIPGDG